MMNRGSNLLIVGLNECAVSRDPEAALVTYALGSCIAVMIYDPVATVAGLLHFMLPEAGTDGERARATPCMFANTGVPLLFRHAYRMGAVKRRILVTAVGGAHVLRTDTPFNIGERNHLALRQILAKAGVVLQQEELGGTAPRSARIQVSNGAITVGHGRQARDLIPAVPQAKIPSHKSTPSSNGLGPRDLARRSQREAWTEIERIL